MANKPADVVDACWTTAGVKIVEPQVLFGTGQCNVLFPRGVPPEYVAGAPIELDAIKCQLKPIDMSDYKVAFTSQQRAQAEPDLPERRVRLVQARRAAGEGRAVRLVRPVAREPAVRYHGPPQPR